MTNRELISAEVEIGASVAKVWSIVSDLRRMGEWSPQCRRMFIFGGELGVGTRTININRQGLFVWPTRSRITVVEPEKELSFRVLENGTEWSFELEPTDAGTRLTESRRAPDGIKKISTVVTKNLMGGTEKFDKGQQAGIEQTLARIKAEAEGI